MYTRQRGNLVSFIMYCMFVLLCPHLCHVVVSVSVSFRCRDRMVVGFTTTYAISAYHQ